MRNKGNKLLSLFVLIPSLIIVFFSNNILINYEDIENWPVIGYYTITSEYGERISPITGFKSFHNGVDIGAPEGSKLVAVIDCEVKFTGFIDGYGCTVKLGYEEEDNIYELIYSHVAPEYIVTEGINVKRGDVIALGGPKYISLNDKLILNGNTTGPHLHFEVRKNGFSINPIIYLNSLEEIIYDGL